MGQKPSQPLSNDEERWNRLQGGPLSRRGVPEGDVGFWGHRWRGGVGIGKRMKRSPFLSRLSGETGRE